ncbi:hypothetical protein TorRG33x02_296640 [Trema orientale]|uniref:Uncharacterized protein n=1 Tax=Trema orientale TaxID=63057 RepID=A0A2P5C5J6_TREOI|nr:hypothetical protein TorRG33x02_296640 [Trema orientale]
MSKEGSTTSYLENEEKSYFTIMPCGCAKAAESCIVYHGTIVPLFSRSKVELHELLPLAAEPQIVELVMNIDVIARLMIWYERIVQESIDMYMFDVFNSQVY